MKNIKEFITEKKFSISSLDFKVEDVKDIINNRELLDKINTVFGKTYKVSEYKGNNINEIYRYFEIIKGYHIIDKINDFKNEKPTFSLDIFENSDINKEEYYGILEIFKDNDNEDIYIIQL